jgi:hypothetical protein
MRQRRKKKEHGMLKSSRTKFTSLALAGGLAVAFSGVASAQDWSHARAPYDHAMSHHYSADRARNELRNGAFYPRGREYGYNYRTPGYNDYGYNSADRDYRYNAGYRDYGYNDGYYDNGPLDVPGAIVGAAVGAADTTVAVATGYPYYDAGYYGGPYGYDPYQNNGWWGPTHDLYYNNGW